MGSAKALRLAAAVVGYLLSPLSPWNDAFVNVPVAVAVAYLFELLRQGLFVVGFAVGYALSNVLGLVLLAAAGYEELRRARGYLDGAGRLISCLLGRRLRVGGCRVGEGARVRGGGSGEPLQEDS